MTPKKISCPNGIRTGHAALYRERIWRLPTDTICGCMTWRVENVSSRVSMTRRNIVQIRRMRLRLMKRQKMYFLRLEKNGNMLSFLHQKAKRVC